MEITPDMSGFRILEYAPLVNARAHPLGANAKEQNKILNLQLKTQYEMFLNILCEMPLKEISTDWWLIVVYYLILQERKQTGLDILKERLL